MADFEKHILKRSDKPYYYRRYLDDIFIIWTESISKLKEIVININICHPTIKLTSESFIVYQLFRSYYINKQQTINYYLF